MFIQGVWFPCIREPVTGDTIKPLLGAFFYLDFMFAIALAVFNKYLDVFISISDWISNRAMPARTCCAVTVWPVGSSNPCRCILNCSHSFESFNSRPFAILISLLHSGGIGFPSSQAVTVLTVLKHNFAVSSLLIQQIYSRKM